MEELPERSEFHRTQRERERERRRVRDRERRLSMTLEQKEKHLERRRRNYQLRRLKAGNLTTNPSFEQSSDSHQAEISIAELDRQQNGFTIIGFNDEQEARNPECIGSLGLENLDQKDASLMGRERVRLNHIRRVARSISHGNSESTMEESISNDMQIGESDPSRSPKALRLTRVKCIARMMKSAVKASDDTENQISISGGKKRSSFYYDIWNIKYLSKFKWDDLTEETAYKNAVREQKLALEISAAKKERDFYLSKVDKSRALSSIDERLKKKQKIQDDSEMNSELAVSEKLPKWIRNFPQTQPVADTAVQNKQRLSKNILAGVFGSS